MELWDHVYFARVSNYIGNFSASCTVCLYIVQLSKQSIKTILTHSPKESVKSRIIPIWENDNFFLEKIGSVVRRQLSGIYLSAKDHHFIMPFAAMWWTQDDHTNDKSNERKTSTMWIPLYMKGSNKRCNEFVSKTERVWYT